MNEKQPNEDEGKELDQDLAERQVKLKCYGEGRLTNGKRLAR